MRVLPGPRDPEQILGPETGLGLGTCIVWWVRPPGSAGQWRVKQGEAPRGHNDKARAGARDRDGKRDTHSDIDRSIEKNR